MASYLQGPAEANKSINLNRDEEDMEYASTESGSNDELYFDRDEPEKCGYQRIANENSDLSPSGSDVEYPIPVEQRQQFKDDILFGYRYGNGHDEELSAADSPSSTDSIDNVGKIESSSHELYSHRMHSPQRNVQQHLPAPLQAVFGDYDESHSVHSSPDSSPRLSDYASKGNYTSSTVSGTDVYSNIHSRYSLPANKSGSATSIPVDKKITLPLNSYPSQSRTKGIDVGTFTSQPSTYNYRDYGNYGSFTEAGDFSSRAGRDNSSKTVRGMNVGGTITRPEHVGINMPDELEGQSKHLPGGLLLKRTTSSYTRDGDDILTTLDKGAHSTHSTGGSGIFRAAQKSGYGGGMFSGGFGSSQSNLQRPGYDSRHYGEKDSLEHQHPDRQHIKSSSTSTTHLTGSAGAARSYGTVPTEPASPPTESTSLDRKKEKRNKRMKKEKDVHITATDGNKLWNKGIDEILAFLGEDNSTPSNKSKKKKDKKDKKKDSESLDKKVNKDKDGEARSSTQSEKKDSQSVAKKKPTNTSKHKAEKQKTVLTSPVTSTCTIGDTTLTSSVTPTMSCPVSSVGASNITDSMSITQTTSNNRLFSRIILSGNSERNIDEEIDKSLNRQSPVPSNPDSPSKEQQIEDIPQNSPALEDEEVAVDVEVDTAPQISQQECKSVSQTIDVTYNIDLDSYCIEEEYIRVKTPEPVEEEFREVVHKKKKGHHIKAAHVDKESKNLVAATTSSAQPSKSSAKPTQSSAVKQRTEQKSSTSKQNYPPQRPTSPASKPVEKRSRYKEYNHAVKQTASERAIEHDLSSESAFPRLCGDHTTTSSATSQPKVATVLPFAWAAKASSKPAPKSSPKSSHGAMGGGDHISITQPTPSEAIHRSSEDTSCQEAAPTDNSSLVSECDAEKAEHVDQVDQVEADSVVTTVGAADAGSDTSHGHINADLSAHETSSYATPPHSKIESHDSSIRSHDSSIRPHDSSIRSHDSSIKSHDSTTRSHDSTTRSHDINSKPHATVESVANTQSATSNITSKDSRSGNAGTRKSPVVEFVGRCSEEEKKSSAVNVQFGFSMDPNPSNKLEFGFGIDEEILSQTSLKQPERSGKAIDSACGQIDDSTKHEPDSAKHEPVSTKHELVSSRHEPVDILQDLLRMCESAGAVNYLPPDNNPDLVRNTARMLNKEWIATEKELKAAQKKPADSREKPKVVYWTPDFDG